MRVLFSNNLKQHEYNLKNGLSVYILGTINTLAIGIAAENQWVYLFFVNFYKMNY